MSRRNHTVTKWKNAARALRGTCVYKRSVSTWTCHQNCSEVVYRHLELLIPPGKKNDKLRVCNSTVIVHAFWIPLCTLKLQRNGY